MFNEIPCTCSLDCKQEARLTFTDIRMYATNEIFDDYDQGILRAMLERNPEFCWCARPACGSGQLHASQDQYPILRCTACNTRTSCFTHHCEWHEGRTCTEYAEDATQSDEVALLQVLSDTSRYRRCPNCRNGVEKNRGCDHMTCKCRHEFCWCCLAPYKGPKGIAKIGNSAHGEACKHFRRSPGR